MCTACCGEQACRGPVVTWAIACESWQPASSPSTKPSATSRRPRSRAAQAPVKPAEYPRFVIQKHAASGCITICGLRWMACSSPGPSPKGPSLDPRDRRLAVEVEDHPLDYGDFEGTIPKGEYGGGTVMLWDRGFWVTEDGGDPERALRKGELKFTLAGEKLQGSWVLVRMRQDRERTRNRNNWLLIKHRDGYERESDGHPVTEQDRSVARAAAWRRLRPARAAAEAIHAGGQGRSIRRGLAFEPEEQRQARPPFLKPFQNPRQGRPAKKRRTKMPQFIAPQLCKRVSRPPAGAEWVHEIKLDGYRMQLRVADGEAVMRTRKGLDWTSDFSAIAEAASGLEDCIIDGEVVALDHNGAPDFAALQAALSEGRSKDLTYFVFDLLFCEGEDLRRLATYDRKKRLQQPVGNRTAAPGKLIKYVEHLAEPGDAVLQSACRLNLEGIISKCASAPYQSGRTDTWLKAKCRGGQEVVIGGWSGSSRNLRSLLVGVYRGDHLVHTGRVGTGFNKTQFGWSYSRSLSRFRPTRRPFGGKGAPRRAKDVTWVKPKLIAEIEFAGLDRRRHGAPSRLQRTARG